MNKYYVIRRKEKSDVLETIVEASTVSEAQKFVSENINEDLIEGEMFLIFNDIGPLGFDQGNRVIIPREASLASITRLH
ncbi:hypothetical protein [Lentibacillus cibarius]|uniref:Uncharacterized protein n=1 Tax=Lentibacillus cibarius TaxID=2583219 RepID=A0A5S3QJD7_9BACI|nr:hypothetical protein [Lentibacillus cibarius]TMN21839.1 hypothetical protein FFL34_06720 [Lentibacillus cibarius]